MSSLTAKAQDGGSSILPPKLPDVPGAAYCLEEAIDEATSVAIGMHDTSARRRSSTREEVVGDARVDDDGRACGSIASAACSSSRDMAFRLCVRAVVLRE
jgi:hypothetical protein